MKFMAGCEVDNDNKQENSATNNNVATKLLFFFSSRRRHTRLTCDWSSDVCSSDLVLTGFLLEIGGGADEQGPAVGSAEHAGEHAGAGLDLVDDLAALAHPDDPAAEAVGYPHRPVRVQAAAVGGDDHLADHLADFPVGGQFAELRPGAAVGQAAVRGDVERGDAVAEGLVD